MQGAPVMRRTIVKGAAWSVPVLAAAVAAPMAAATTGPVLQTQCIGAADASASYTTGPVTPPYDTQDHGDGRPEYIYKQGQSYEMTTTMTITYSGALPSNISDLSFYVIGTNWFEWSLAGTPSITSSRGNIAYGSHDELAVADPSQRRGATSIYPVATGSDAYVHPGDVITVTWNFTAHGPTSPIGVTGSGFAYAVGSMSSCSGTAVRLGPNASTTTALYQYVL